MIVAIADDFSGASEIAGIGWRYGLSTEVQLNFDAASNADLLVVDADTRSQTRADAIEKTKALAEKIKNSGKPVKLFKKVDSVFRGYIIDEINALQNVFSFERVLLLPANPGRQRTIVSGHYFVNKIPLDKTVFAYDPQFPAISSSIKNIIAAHSPVLVHQHLQPGESLPFPALITGDVASKGDIKSYVIQTNDKDLYCGGAECFEVYLENKGYIASRNSDSQKFLWPPYCVIVSGSTVLDQFNDDIKHALAVFPLPGQWQGEHFNLEPASELTWQIKVLDHLKKNHLAAVAIEQEIRRTNKATNNFSDFFARLLNYLSQEVKSENIHLAITGGATASDIIKNESLYFEVKQEIAPGIVTLVSKHTERLFTVKPGSYLWPSAFIKSLSSNHAYQTHFRN